MVTGINTAIQIVSDVISKETQMSILKNVSKIESLAPRPMTTNRHSYDNDYFITTQNSCISTLPSKNVILPLYDYVVKNESILKQCTVVRETIPYNMLYYVEFDNGLKFEMYKDSVLLVKIKGKFEPIKLRDIAVGSTIQTVSNIGCKLSVKADKSNLDSQTYSFDIQGIPDNYYCAITNCNSSVSDFILIRR